MSLVLRQHPEQEPLNLEEVRLFLKIDHKEEDYLLENLIKTARQAVEAYTGRALIEQTWGLNTNFDFSMAISDRNFLRNEIITSSKGLELPRSPFIDLVELPKIILPYRAIELSDFRIDTTRSYAKIHFFTYPSLSDSASFKKLQIIFRVGYGKNPSDVPESLRHAILLGVADLYEKRTSVNDNQSFSPFSAFLNREAINLIAPYRHIRLI